jgi:dolichol-phosphate mannosyltransferase
MLIAPILSSGTSVLAFLCVLFQVPALCILLARLLPSAWRSAPLAPRLSPTSYVGFVSVVVPTLNEVDRLQPCLRGLNQQSDEVREILVVDSRSQDGTPEQVQKFQHQEPRLQLLEDAPLPPGWVGRPWALHHGFQHMSPESTWFLGMDADTQPQPGLVASLVQAAEAAELDLVTLSPQFILQYPGEIWLQPALLITLVYRFGAAGDRPLSAARAMANGQCCLCRRSLLQQLNGFTAARNSFSDDVTLVRHAAALGARVAFWDGARVLKVRMYEGALETWREWGRSLDLKDASSQAQVWGDIWFLWWVQGLPLWLLLGFILQGIDTITIAIAVALNGFLILFRWALLWAIAPSYDLSSARGKGLFWLSPLADSLAVVRITLSSLQRPTQWRGRQYGGLTVTKVLNG